MVGLASYFDGVAAKRLSAVEVDATISNQHEFNGVGNLRSIFGVKERRREIFARHFDMDRTSDPTNSIVRLTWYDSRFAHPTRTEWRLYYFAELAPSLVEGGTLVVANRGEQVFLFTAAPGTAGDRALRSLFSLDGLSSSFSVADDQSLSNAVVSATEKYVLAELGVSGPEERSLADHMFDVFGDAFPKGEALSRFVRDNTFGVNALADPDEALLAWARVELELFNAMESRVESEAMDAAATLDDKLAVAMRVFQRRKSRAGKAFEYHLRALFDLNRISYSSNPVTEGREEPDFIFPGIEAYRDAMWPNASLAMLAAKQTLRDRWRQVLQEANRIERKHLATLDVNVSSNQIREIDASGIQLVMPAELHGSYSELDREYLWSIQAFIDWVRSIGD